MQDRQGSLLYPHDGDVGETRMVESDCDYGDRGGRGCTIENVGDDALLSENESADGQSESESGTCGNGRSKSIFIVKTIYSEKLAIDDCKDIWLTPHPKPCTTPPTPQ